MELRLRSDPVNRNFFNQAARAVLSAACNGVIVVGRDFISCYVTRDPFINWVLRTLLLPNQFRANNADLLLARGEI